MKITILSILTALAAFPQAQTPLRVFNSAGSSTGAVWLQERRTNGANWIKLEAPQSIAADFSLIFPSAAPAGNDYCLVSSTAGVMSFIACSQNAFVQSGNSFGAAAILGTNDSNSLSFETDSATRWTITAAGMLHPALDNTYDDGLTGTRSRVSYAHNFDGAPSGTTGNYARTRKLELVDTGGASGFWHISANGTTGTSSINVIDNSGSRWMRGYRALASTPTNDTFFYGNWIPAGRSIAGGDAVDDIVLPTIGNTGNRWSKAWINSLYALWYAEDVKPLSALLSIGSVADPWLGIHGRGMNISNYAGALNEVTAVARQYNYESSSDAGAFKAEGWQLSGTGSNVRGAESHAACAEIASDAFSAPTCANVWGLEVGIRTNRTPASSSSNVGIYVNSDSAGWLAGADLNCNSVGTTRGCRNGIGVMVSGSDGWEKPFAYYDDVSSLLWYVNLSGVTVMSGFNMGPGAASGLVLTSDGSGNGTWAASTVTAPLTLSLAANAYSEPLFIQNPSHGAFGACMVMNTSDTVSTIYKTGRICSRFESASFTDELLTIQTTTNGSNGWDVALSIKNLVVTVPGTFVSGPASISSLTMAGSQTPGLDSLGNVGTPSVRYGSMATYNLNAGGGSGVITFLPGAAPAVGYVWTASSTAGVGGWAAAGGQWTTVGSDIYRNSFIGIGDFSSISISAPIHISYGSSAAMFFDGLGAFAPNFLMRHSNGTAASPTASANGDRLGQFAVQGYGTSRVTTAGVGFFAEATHTGSSAPTKISFSTTASGSTTRAVRWDIEGAGNILPVASTTYNIGSTSNKVLDIHTSFIDLYTDLTFNSGATFTGDMVPSVSNVYSVGNTSFRLSGVVTTALNVTGAVTTPVGSAGYSGNVSVRNAADTGSCTLSFSGGWLYAATGC